LDRFLNKATYRKKWKKGNLRRASTRVELVAGERTKDENYLSISNCVKR